MAEIRSRRSRPTRQRRFQTMHGAGGGVVCDLPRQAKQADTPFHTQTVLDPAADLSKPKKTAIVSSPSSANAPTNLPGIVA
ncbi:hypothetical protein [Geobacillus kaustophilus]|uniref:hypothetical protein n=1 Tax=Geobacillus kaustophilus TaxID=1462 RepID=UPI0012DFEA60|nr:hypothetical protein [Geobacillus kaustophilus]